MDLCNICILNLNKTNCLRPLKTNDPSNLQTPYQFAGPFRTSLDHARPFRTVHCTQNSHCLFMATNIYQHPPRLSKDLSKYKLFLLICLQRSLKLSFIKIHYWNPVYYYYCYFYPFRYLRNKMFCRKYTINL